MTPELRAGYADNSREQEAEDVNLNGRQVTWAEADLDPTISDPDIEIGWRYGYGAHLGDINDDGYPDFVPSRSQKFTDPNIWTPVWGFYLNTGNPNSYFVSVADCLDIADAGLSAPETIAFGDVDGDGDLDVFLPGYEADNLNPDPHDLAGNRLLLNLGADSHDPNDPNSCRAGPPYAPQMDPNETINAGLQNYGTDPNDMHTYFLRSEGVQLVDYDYDGDLDAFFSDHVWQNVTMLDDTPRYRRLDLNHSGVVVRGDREDVNGGWPEEGLLVQDFDMDGDLDFLRTMKLAGLSRLSLSRGDGTFESDPSVGQGYGFGTSCADWDNDGDLDFTAGGNFFRNLTVEGSPGIFVRIGCVDDFFCASHQYGLPSWADVDRDGDLDCAMGGWGQGASVAKFYRNHLYLADCGDCDEGAKRYVKVRPVRAAAENGPKGSERDYTENEFGARVELVVRSDPNGYSTGLRRVQVTSAAGGYLNQNEYPLHFGPPPDPDPNDPNEDLRLDVYVDFPTRAHEPQHSPWRVDWTVNPQLTDINLADLYDDCRDPETLGRPITVYRDGRVRFKGADPNWTPADPNIARLYTLGGALRLPDPNIPGIPVLTTGNVFAGVRFVTEPNFPEMRIREIIVDGQLDQTTSGCAYNVVVLDVSDPNNKTIVGGLKARTFAGNQRTFIHVPPPDPNAPDFVLLRNDSVTTRTYEVRVRVTSYDLSDRPDPNGLLTDFHVRVDRGLNNVNVFSAVGTLCTQTMTLRGDTKTPVTVRFSPTGN